MTWLTNETRKAFAKCVIGTPYGTPEGSIFRNRVKHANEKLNG